MYRHSFRNRVVTGAFTLSIMSCIALVLWVLPDVCEGKLWAGAAMTGLGTLLMTELSNRNSLLRIRSRMTSTTFLFLMAMCPMIHEWTGTSMLPLCFLLSYFMLFSSYQKIRPEGYIFHAFFFAGLGSMIFPPMLVIALAYYFSMLFQLRNLSWRTFMAGLLGLLVPYWFYAVYAIWNGTLRTAFLYLTDWFDFVRPDFAQIPLPQWITAGTLLFFALIAFCHFFHTAYNDKIRTRIFYYVMATQEVVIVAGLVLYPQYFNEQLPLFVVNSSLFIAHYYALGKGRFFDTWFNISWIILAVMGIYNYISIV